LSADDVDHVRSLRLRPDESFIVCDGGGSDYICRLCERGAENAGGSGRRSGGEGGVIAEIIETQPSRGEPSVLCSVYIAFAKGDRLEYAVQKSVELGAYEIVLFPSERCVYVPNDKGKNTARLQRIALETAKQCGRGRIPEVMAEDSFTAAIGRAAGAALPLFFYECEDRLHLKQALELHSDARTISVVTGPEGGFESSEAESARTAGMLAVTLGPRILRCETAPAAALAAIMYHTGNL
jgi:16S rRNA (uracil1498-N3)-methyltransferase